MSNCRKFPFDDLRADRPTPSRGSTVARRILAVGLVLAISGCSSNKFALSRSKDNSTGAQGLAALGQPRIRVPAAPGGDAPSAYAGNPYGIVPAAPQQTGVAPPYSQAESPPLVASNQSPFGGPNSPRVTETPRPGELGTRLELASEGPEIRGRVVNHMSRPEPSASVSVVDLSQNGRVVAELATAADGTFRILNLRNGVRYELIAVGTREKERMVGRTVARAPDANVMIQLEKSNDSAFMPRHGRVPTRSLATLRPSSAEAPQAIDRALGSQEIPGLATVETPKLLRHALELPVAPTSLYVKAEDRDRAGSIQTAGGGSDPRRQAPARLRRDLAQLASPLAIPEERSRSASGNDGAALSRSNASAAPPPANAIEPSGHAAFSGTPLAAFQLIALDQQPMPLSSLTGDVILLEFFGSWCGPCRHSIPIMNKLHQTYATSGLEIVGVACEAGTLPEAVGQAHAARQALDIEYTVVANMLDAPCPLRDYFRVDRYPTLVLLDRQGNLLFHGTGGTPETFHKLETAIRQALSQPKLAASNPSATGVGGANNG